MDSRYDGWLRELVQHHTVDTIFEEATSLPSKSCVELLADELGLQWLNVDLTLDERKELPDSALKSQYDTLQDLEMHRQRESAWAKKIEESNSRSVLLVCGLCHVFSVGESLRSRRIEVEAHIYTPKRIFNWSNRPRVASKAPSQS